MPAGKNLFCSIIDHEYEEDDVAGAVPSGVVISENVYIRIHPMNPTDVLLEQGVETVEMYNGFIYNYTETVTNNMEIEVTAPYNSPYFGERFRVTGNPRYSSLHPSDSRSYMKVKLRRTEQSRSIQ